MKTIATNPNSTASAQPCAEPFPRRTNSSAEALAHLPRASRALSPSAALAPSSGTRRTTAVLLFLTFLVACCLPAGAVQVVFTVVDQNGKEIPGSVVTVQGVGTIKTGESGNIPSGDFLASVTPGIMGAHQCPGYEFLTRVEPLRVTADTTTVTFEWIVQDVTIDLRDQSGKLIPDSLIRGLDVYGCIDVGDWWKTALPPSAPPVVVRMPVNDKLTYPTVGGTAASGYPIRLYPGINGTKPCGDPTTDNLARDEVVQVTPQTTAVTFEWRVQDVTIDLQDQSGKPIPGSRVAGADLLECNENGGYWVTSIPPCVPPVVARLPVIDKNLYPTMHGRFAGGYPLRLYPGINGATPCPNGNEEGVLREEVLQVTAQTTAMTYQWIVKDITIDLRDQSGSAIPASMVYGAHMIGCDEHWGFWLWAIPPSVPPVVVRLPVTDSQIYPALAGRFKGGYPIRLAPGVNGTRPCIDLAGDAEGVTRDEILNVTPLTTSTTYHWIVQDVTIGLRDQSGNGIPRSLVGGADGYGCNEYGGYYYWAIPPSVPPAVVKLPVTDHQVYPAVKGRFANGYPIRLYPGIDGATQGLSPDTGLLRRDHVLVVSPQTSAVSYEWICARCPMAVVGSSGAQIGGSTFTFRGGVHQNGDVLQLPTTDNATYPGLLGEYANGYPFAVSPGGVLAAETFQFEVLPGGALVPEWFTMNNSSYGLRFICNQPPKVDAGPNVSIPSSQESATTINGTATDPDGDWLTYRWLEGDTELLAWTSAGPSGACPLNLANVPQALPLGPHTLRLEVNDGTVTVSDTMILTIGNSPPTLACAGRVNALVWSPVALHASVADFDGDTLSYTWSYGQLLVYQGTIQAPAGGTPVELPTVTYPAGFDVGTYTFTLTVSDAQNPSVTCSLDVSVTDTEGPKLQPVASPSILWPPNHTMMDVLIETHATDNSRDPVTLTVNQIASTEDPDKAGDGHTIPDSQVIDINQATGVIHLQLRSERSGKGPGRTYTITITATDKSGNKTTVSVQVQAPHDKGK